MLRKTLNALPPLAPLWVICRSPKARLFAVREDYKLQTSGLQPSLAMKRAYSRSLTRRVGNSRLAGGQPASHLDGSRNQEAARGSVRPAARPPGLNGERPVSGHSVEEAVGAAWASALGAPLAGLSLIRLRPRSPKEQSSEHWPPWTSHMMWEVEAS
jgi:hypothetical protein